MEYSENQIPEREEEKKTVLESADAPQGNSAQSAETSQPAQEPAQKETAQETEKKTSPQPEGGHAADTFGRQPWSPYPNFPQMGYGYQPPQSKRKESPFANSPYVMNSAWQRPHAPEMQPQNPPRPPKTNAAKKTAPKKVWQMVVSAVVVLALIIGACFVTASVVDYNWQKQATAMVEDFHDRMDALEKQIDGMDVPGATAAPDSNANGGNISGNTGSTANNGAAAQGLLTPAQVYERNVDSVVLIHNLIRSANGQTGYSTGSGFIMSKDGYVVTNHHVIEGNGTLTVITNDGTEYPAELIGSDNTNDVALLKIEANNLQAVTIGSSDTLVVGDQVAAIGNPLGELTSTLTVGYVSAKERDVNTVGFAINMLQTDAAINSGNSGGPLFNMRGEVVGITTAKYSGTSSSGASIEGVGFAIPIDDVLGMLNDLATYGYINTAYMGVNVADMDADTADYYGMPLGAYVQSVERGGPAQKAGIRAKDIIVKLGDYDIENVNDLGRALRNLKAGDVITVIVYRSSTAAEVKLTITLEEKPASN